MIHNATNDTIDLQLSGWLGKGPRIEPCGLQMKLETTLMCTTTLPSNHTHLTTHKLHIICRDCEGISCPKISPQNQLYIYFVTSRQYWLGIAKLKFSSD